VFYSPFILRLVFAFYAPASGERHYVGRMSVRQSDCYPLTSITCEAISPPYLWRDLSETWHKYSSYERALLKTFARSEIRDARGGRRLAPRGGCHRNFAKRPKTIFSNQTNTNNPERLARCRSAFEMQCFRNCTLS